MYFSASVFNIHRPSLSSSPSHSDHLFLEATAARESCKQWTQTTNHLWVYSINFMWILLQNVIFI